GGVWFIAEKPSDPIEVLRLQHHQHLQTFRIDYSGRCFGRLLEGLQLLWRQDNAHGNSFSVQGSKEPGWKQQRLSIPWLSRDAVIQSVGPTPPVQRLQEGSSTGASSGSSAVISC